MTELGQPGADDATEPGRPSETPAGPMPRPAQGQPDEDPGGDVRGRAGPPRPAGTRWRRSGEDGEGALRGLLDGGRSKITLSSAMRARDVARPDADDLADAERLIAGRIAADRARAARPAIRRPPPPGRRPPRPAPPGRPDEADPGRA
ncbi:hypothetical protein [Pseudofrankia inefficax]|uniref:Uncharacterized protein n=1 Tax=Pseudofrankia inefficax (strain DSM 45817 / CECT 9037 / DDB 130130 / EuI1c) TaxID=298654 RepID=E3J5M4_PSEI1|nr:hypothetical protein [Pseudofrankia inefficax]ADP83111.1 hypothetical protein FraEuI1c_5122 [Pseudofrankia inefficax]